MSGQAGLYARWGKRTLDVAVASCALVVFAPVVVAVAVTVRARMGSPVLFRQRRPGRDAEPFTILKFRTMSDARDGGGNPLPDDRRLTPLGKLLRKTSLDELPQLVNVLRGEMSLVGPRPLAFQYLQFYSPREATRHDVRPGITGLAQVNGRNEICWDDRLELDARYAARVTFAGDMRILWGTIAKVLRRSDVREDPTSIVSLHHERANRREAA
jgi:undecaprenyl phosphate N,N'-diacetylbacillosamine 1-phosphate transferase